MNRTSIFSASCILALAICTACAQKQEQSSGAAAGASAKQAPNVKAIRVEVATVEKSRSVLRIVRPGEVEGAREAHLASALGGFVEAVLVENGAQVEKGKPIAYVDTSTHNAQANLTRIEVADAERELARLEKLGKAIPTVRVDNARTRVERARAQHALSRTRQARAVIRAPFSGSIVDLRIERGEVVAPGMPIARLIALDPVHVSVSVADRDVAALRVGSAARVSTASVPDPVSGVIHHIESAADLETRTFMVEVAVDNPDKKLLPGMIARVSFDEQAGDLAIFLPQDLLVTTIAENGVFVVTEGDIARWRPVTLGAIIGTQVQVTSGLNDGDQLVTLGQRSLTDGDSLLIMRHGVCCRDGRVVFDQEDAATPVTERGNKTVDTAITVADTVKADDAAKAGDTGKSSEVDDQEVTR